MKMLIYTRCIQLLIIVIYCKPAKTAVPGQVRNLTLLPTSEGITTSWEAPLDTNNTSIKYTVLIFVGKTNSIFDSTFNSPNNSFTSSNLYSGNCYTLSVTAINDDGPGYPVSKYFKTTDRVPGYVRGREEDISSTTMRIRWRKPVNANGVIVAYSVTLLDNLVCKYQAYIICTDCQPPCPGAISTMSDDYSPAAISNILENTTCSQMSNDSFNQHDSSFSHEATGLKPNTFYQIYVTAYTMQGKGRDSAAYKRTDEDVPELVRNVTLVPATNEIGVTCRRPSSTNGAITRYEVQYYAESGTNLCQNVSSDYMWMNITDRKNLQNPVVEVVIMNLRPFWLYYIRIRAWTRVGPGNWTIWATAKTKPSLSSPVQDIKFGRVSDSNIELLWAEPCYPNGVIKQYHVHVSSSDRVENTAGNETHITISNLLPFKNYSFIIYVETETHGNTTDGAMSPEIQTQCALPHPARDVVLKYKTATTLTISWKQPDLKTCDTNYTATAKDMGDDSFIKSCSTAGFDHVECTIKGLDEYWPYVIVVKTSTIIGTVDSSNITVKTDSAAPGKVQNLLVRAESNVTEPRNLYVSWQPPSLRDRNGYIGFYYISYNSTSHNIQGVLVSLPTALTAVLKLKGGLHYDIEVFASTTRNATLENRVKFPTIYLPNGAPFLHVPQYGPIVLSQFDSRTKSRQLSVNINIYTICDETNGEIQERGIIVSDATKVSSIQDQNYVYSFRGTKTEFDRKLTRDFLTWKQASVMDNMAPYVATTRINPNCTDANYDGVITVLIGKDGDCKTSSEKYCNGYLNPGKKYKLSLYVCTDNGCSMSRFYGPFTKAPDDSSGQRITHSSSRNLLTTSISIVVISIARVMLFE